MDLGLVMSILEKTMSLLSEIPERKGIMEKKENRKIVREIVL
jgi:hypothetical protein